MPYSIFRVSLKHPSDRGAEIRDIFEQAIDQAAIRNIPVFDISIEEECGDPPNDDNES